MAAPMFPVNTHRHDPYRTFKFAVEIDSKPVAGLRKMSALKKTTEVTTWRTAGDPSHERKLPGTTKYEPVTLEQGLTHDPVFEEWANKVNQLTEGDAAMSLKEFRKDVVINVFNLQGQVVIKYKLFRAWVSEFQALPDLDAGGNEVGIQMIKLEHEGWERDDSHSEPSES